MMTIADIIIAAQEAYPECIRIDLTEMVGLNRWDLNRLSDECIIYGEGIDVNGRHFCRMKFRGQKDRENLPTTNT